MASLFGLLSQPISRRYASIIAKLNERFTLDFFVFEIVLGLSHEAHTALLADFKELFRKPVFGYLKDD